MPIARFQMPDGRIARFDVPEGTSPEQAQAMMASYDFGGTETPKPVEDLTPYEEKGKSLSPLSATASLLGEGFSGGLGRKLAAAAVALPESYAQDIPYGEAYGNVSQRMDAIRRGMQESAGTAGDVAETAGLIGGGLAATPAKWIGAAKGLAGLTGRSAAAALPIGAAQSFGVSEAPTFNQQLQDAATGGLLSAGLAGAATPAIYGIGRGVAAATKSPYVQTFLESAEGSVPRKTNIPARAKLTKDESALARLLGDESIAEAYKKAAAIRQQGRNVPAALLLPEQQAGVAKALAQTSAAPQAMRSAARFEDIARQQAGDIVSGLGGSPRAATEDLALSFAGGGRDIGANLARARSEAARQAWSRFRGQELPEETIAGLRNMVSSKDAFAGLKNPAFVEAEKALRSTPLGGQLNPRTLQYLDLVRRQLASEATGAYGAAGTPLKQTQAPLYQEAAERTRDIMRQASPDYAQYLQRYGADTSALKSVAQSRVGRALGLLDDTGEMTAERALQGVRQVMGREPLQVAQSRKLFEKSGKLGEWNQGVRSFINQEMAKQGDDLVRVFNKANRARINAALGDNFKEGINKLLNITDDVKAMRDIVGGGSQTAALNESIKLLNNTTRTLAGKASKAAGKGIDLATGGKLGIGQRALEAAETAGIDYARQARIAELLFDDDGIKLIERLAKLSKDSSEAKEIAKILSSRAAGISAGASASIGGLQ